ncbi:hypothetical protein ACMA1I_17740 [Pontibacter sp. 13R65]
MNDVFTDVTLKLELVNNRFASFFLHMISRSNGTLLTMMVRSLNSKKA